MQAKTKARGKRSSAKPGPRAALAEAVSQYHLVDRRLTLHCQVWRKTSAPLGQKIDRLWAAERQAPCLEFVPADVRREGEAALDLCNSSHDRKESLMRLRHQKLQEVFVELGAYYGQLMASDNRGGLLFRFERYLARAFAERAQNVDHVRVKGVTLADLESFAMMAGWAKALGYRSTRTFVADLSKEIELRSGLRSTALCKEVRLVGLPA
ncbi:hypothetical protein [Ralstonia pseudosolanacearum]|uniref:hypothetical protein n=1 Tax=Ralstonia pseudosolanacearum TaxID=1310165 RepID=UPI003CF4DA59